MLDPSAEDRVHLKSAQGEIEIDRMPCPSIRPEHSFDAGDVPRSNVLS
jgi:hypothetical protein